MTIEVRGLLYEKQAVVASCLEEVTQQPSDDRFVSLRNALLELTHTTKKTLKTHSFKQVNEAAFRREEASLFSLLHTSCSKLSTSTPENKAVAAFCKAMCYSYGFGVEESRKTGAALLRFAEKHYPKAGFYLSRHFLQKNKTLATKRLLRAVAARDPGALLHQAVLYGKGIDVERNDAEMVRLLQEAAEKNSKNAFYNLALCYKTGRGVPQNQEEALRLFSKALQLECDGWGIQKAFTRDSFRYLKETTCVLEGLHQAEEFFSELLQRAVNEKVLPAQVFYCLISLMSGENINPLIMPMLFEAAAKGMVEAKVFLFILLPILDETQDAALFSQDSEKWQVLDWIKPYVENENAPHMMQKVFLECYKSIASTEKEIQEYLRLLVLFALEYKNPKAQEELGERYIHGDGVLQDVRQGTCLLQEAERRSCASLYSRTLASMFVESEGHWSFCTIL